MFFDRDGVLNKALVRDGAPFPPPSVEELELVDEADFCLHQLNSQGYLLIVATNQPDVRRGIQTRQEVDRINTRLRDLLPLDDIFVCYHDTVDKCDCRKPQPGLILRAAARYDIDLATSFFVGDRNKDIQAGDAAGCTTIWIDCRYSEPPPTSQAVTVSTLREACDWILNRTK